MARAKAKCHFERSEIMEQISIKELEKDLRASKAAVTGTYVASFGYAIASVCEAFFKSPAEAAAYAFCAAVAYVASAVIGTRIDDANNALENARTGGLEMRL